MRLGKDQNPSKPPHHTTPSRYALKQHTKVQYMDGKLRYCNLQELSKGVEPEWKGKGKVSRNTLMSSSWRKYNRLQCSSSRVYHSLVGR
jgi:hypothetical protein